ncbi:MAG: hypothetical protein HKN56_00900 [Gammaproteobacteria bacterium]|nr:hypothetical protein [Gammaproteobacteria bacterium]
MGDSIANDACPHSLIIQGARGTGRRDLALWLAAELLGGPVWRQTADGEGYEPANPDFLPLIPAVDKSGKEKKTIGIDQIRDDLIPFMNMTSHGSGARVAAVYPADAMTVNAANSLLKTLEEPPAGSMIVLITETLAGLPATVVSRCQRIRIAAPPAEDALRWLAGQVPGQDFSRMLEFSGGAPLAALTLLEEDFPDFANGFLGGLEQLEQRSLSPVELAARCKDREALALQLLEWRLAERIRAAAERNSAHSAGAAAGFRQLGQIRELRRVLNGGINAELNLAGLLLDWYGGFGRRQE